VEVNDTPLPNMLTSCVYKNSTGIEDFQWPDIKSKWPQSPNCSNWGNLSVIDPKFEQLRTWWRLRFEDVMVPAPEILPLFWEVNHRINILNPNSHYTERRPICPQALEGQL